MVRLLSTPVRLSGPLVLSQLVLLVVADEHPDVEWLPSVLAGDLSGQYAAERELAKQGHDRATLGREAFVERVRAFEAERRRAAAQTFAKLGLHLDLDAAAVDRDDVVRAARTAFVQLYEAGLLHREEQVVDTCPRCATVVDAADARPSELEGARVLIDLGEGLVVPTMAPELLPGVVAVVAPDGPAEVKVPIADRTVPVLAGDEPAFVVPAHDAAGLEVARAHGLFPVEVLNDLGEVVHDGPLFGMARYAARSAARDLLGDVATEPALEPVAKCRRCGTVVVPRLGLHWFLDMTGLEVLAADHIREGLLDVSPPAYRDELLERAGAGGSWCLSHQVWGGSPVPVWTCLDCGQLSVAVEQPSSCGKCMGELAADDSVLDARFIGAVWPLVVAGWPDAKPDPAEAVLLTTQAGVVRWALPMAALALTLAGTAPFAGIVVSEVRADPGDPEPVVMADLDALIEAEGADAVRAALRAGGLPDPTD